MTMLSVLIPGRNEEFMARTIACVLKEMRGDTEVIAVCDGSWPDPAIQDHPRVNVIHFTKSVGQRASTNAAARLSQAKYLMKLDAHCNVDEGFDVKLMQPYESGELTGDVTTIPRMYNLHAFSWKCGNCGNETYQGPTPTECLVCKAGRDFERIMVWKPRLGRRTDFARIDKEVRFKYWRRYEKRRDVRRQGDLAEVLCAVGACWMMPAARFWDLGGMDETTGSWGQFGVEISCKSWLSGGRQIVNKRTWFSHLFRTQWKFQWPYPISQTDIDAARAYSKDLWLNDRWPKQQRAFAWLIEKFKPVPEWHEEITKEQRESESHANADVQDVPVVGPGLADAGDGETAAKPDDTRLVPQA